MTLDEIGTRLEAARGRIDRIYCHWTGAPYQLVECLAYHVVIDRGGYCHVIHEDFTECLAHTWHRNSRSIGVALACCRDACCYYDAPSGVDLGCEPPTEAQVEALAMFCARAVEELGLSVSDIYTHAEMAAFDGYGIGSDDPDMRWDLLYVPDYGDGGRLVPGGELIRGKRNITGSRGAGSCVYEERRCLGRRRRFYVGVKENMEMKKSIFSMRE